MADPTIKPDPDTKGASPALFDDDDIYEDAGDLEFNNDTNFQSMYLARIPRYVWESWSKLDDDAEIQIGTIRQTTVQTPQGPTSQLSMLLKSDLAAHQMVPKEYSLDITSENVSNTFAFTEQDLPGFKSKSRQKYNEATANMPARLTRPKKDEKTRVTKDKQPWDPNRKFEPYIRKAIPKRTTLAGTVKHEVNCVPVENEESNRIMAMRTLEAMKPKVHTKFVSEDPSTLSSNFIQPGTIGASSTFGNFIKTKSGASNQKVQTQKTARMPQNELLDRIFQCFRRYKYWSMKALRAELLQPEAYLRETLEKVAILAKSGRFATQWSLRPENSTENMDAIGDAIAPTVDGVEDSDMAEGDDDDEEEDVKFEDVT